MMFLVRFWRNLTKKDSVESATYDINNFSTCTYIFWTFFFLDPDFPDRNRIFLRSGSGVIFVYFMLLHLGLYLILYWPENLIPLTNANKHFFVFMKKIFLKVKTLPCTGIFIYFFLSKILRSLIFVIRFFRKTVSTVVIQF